MFTMPKVIMLQVVIGGLTSVSIQTRFTGSLNDSIPDWEPWKNYPITRQHLSTRLSLDFLVPLHCNMVLLWCFEF